MIALSALSGAAMVFCLRNDTRGLIRRTRHVL